MEKYVSKYWFFYLLNTSIAKMYSSGGSDKINAKESFKLVWKDRPMVKNDTKISRRHDQVAEKVETGY